MKTLSNWTDAFAAKFRKTPLSGLEGHQGRRNIWVSGYPISGNSYISYVIAYVLNCKYRDVDSVDWSPQRVPLKKYLCGTNSHARSHAYDCVLKTHAPPSTLPNTSDDRLLYVARNVHDVANSYFHRVEKTWHQSSDWKRRFLIRLSKRIIPFRFRHRIAIRYFSRRWASQVKEVLNEPDISILKYEQFMESPLETLERVILHIDPASWNEEVARQALEIFSLKNMKTAASQAGLDASSHTDRVGGSGDYQKYFSPTDIKWFEQEYRSILSDIDVRARFGPSNRPTSS